jgi:hypothetical protein
VPLRVRSPYRVTRAALLGRAAPLSSTRRFDPESPIRWLVRARSGNTGLCGSERGELSDVGRSASNGKRGAAGRLLAGASRAQARGCAEVPLCHSFLREASLAPELHRASRCHEEQARARGTAARARKQDHRRPTPRAPAARDATTCPRAAEGRDLPGLRSPLLRSGTQSLVVRVPSFDECAERSVHRPLPDGIQRATAIRARAYSASTGARRAQVLRRVRPGLEPVELQALVPVFVDEPICANCGRREQSRVSFQPAFW